MAFDYSAIADLSLELLTEFGADVTRRSYTIGTYDPATGSNTVTTADTTRKGAVFNFGANQSLANGTLIQVGDLRLMVDAEGVVNMQDHFIIGSKEFVIISMDEVKPAGVAVLYDLHIRTA